MNNRFTKSGYTTAQMHFSIITEPKPLCHNDLVGWSVFEFPFTI